MIASVRGRVTTIGPDGAVYIADLYQEIIQHNQIDFRDGANLSPGGFALVAMGAVFAAASRATTE